MIRRNRKLMAVAAVGLGLGGIAWTGVQNYAADPRPAAMAAREESVVTGNVKSIVKNDRGDVDGLLLDSKQLVHFPPHMAKAVLEITKVGERVTVAGREEVRPDQTVVFEASAIESGGKKVVIEKPRPPRPAARDELTEVTKVDGTVVEMNTNRHGDVDGFNLKDGTEVKFPPHQAAELVGVVQAGQEVSVEGRRRVMPGGEVAFHADRITDVPSGKTVERDEPMPPPNGPRPPRPPHPEAAARHQSPSDPLGREILDELRAIRRLLEQQKDESHPGK